MGEPAGGGGCVSGCRGTSPDRGCSYLHPLIRSVLVSAPNFFEGGITRLIPQKKLFEAFLDTTGAYPLPTGGRGLTRTHFFEDGITRLNMHSLIRSVLRHDGRSFGAWRRNRRRPGECRAELTKYAAARPLFALRAGRMAASGIICRGIFLGSDVALTRAPKVPPKIVGPLRGE